jgi:hypothetical protein
MRTTAPTKAPLRIDDLSSVVNSPAWIEWFQRISDYYESISKWIDVGLGGIGNHEPINPSEGLLAYANGVGWNPGSGEGYYRYQSGIWVVVGGSGLSSSVVSEILFGQLPVIGISTTVSREDHSHGTPVNPIIAHLLDSDPHSQYHNDIRGDIRYYTRAQIDVLLANSGGYAREFMLMGA